MTEYLTKNSSGNYQLVNHRFSVDDIAVPEGAEIFTQHEYGDCFYKKGENSLEFFDNSQWEVSEYDPVNYENEMSRSGRDVVWVRESLNDKVASAEVVRQKHSHYKKDVSHLKSIDVYRVLDLFNVEGHEVGHAIKKLLCSGQRGAKDHKQDIQEAIDSLNRHLEMLAEDEAL